MVGATGTHRATLEIAPQAGGQRCHGEMRIPQVARWWPHTHGDPSLYDVRFEIETIDGPATIDGRPVGFRSLAAGPTVVHEIERDGLQLHVNGVALFIRGAVWTPLDPIGLAPSPGDLRAAIETVREAGMNMLRVGGHRCLREDAFYDLCDELGMLVWQDFMFANMDYPFADDELSRLRRARGRGRCPDALRRAGQLRRAVREQRDRAAGGHARS